MLRPGQRSARLFRPDATHRDSRAHELVGGSQRGREWRGVEIGEHMFRVVQAPDQEQATDLEIVRKCGVQPVSVLFERHPRRLERLRRPAQVARDKCDFGLGDDTPSAGHGFFWTKGARSTPQENLRSHEIAELRHRNPSKRESGWVVTEGNPLQCAEGITRCECTRCGSDQRIHRNPVTLVTPTVSMSQAKFIV